MVSASRRKERETSVRFEVHQETTGHHRLAKGVLKPEVFVGLDRARLAALALALDGAVPNHGITGVVRIERVFYAVDREIGREVIDEIDERVAGRFLNEIRLPRVGHLSIGVDELQGEVDCLNLNASNYNGLP